MWTKLGPGPQIAKDVNVFRILFFFDVLMSPVWWGLHDTLVPLNSTYGSPGPPKIKKKLITNFHQITSIFYMLLEDSLIWSEIYFKICMGPWRIYKKCLRVLLTHVYWFRATGGYICGCGRPSNLVSLLIPMWWVPMWWVICCYKSLYVDLVAK